ncbi:MAG: hypothetical protein ABIN48_02250 [Ginsengibacter sp.]
MFQYDQIVNYPTSFHIFIAPKKHSKMLSEIIIRVDNERIYFNPTVSISWSQTNIPKEHLKFKKEVYWRVELIQYIEENKYWEVKVVDYSVAETETFSRQKPTREIRGLTIVPLEWEHLEPLLFMHVKAKLGEHIIDLKPDYVPRTEWRFPGNKQFLSEPFLRTISIIFPVKFTEAHFSPGCINFTKRIPDVMQDVSFQILNEHILGEFEDIKNWFSKKIGGKFIVKAIIETQDGEVTSVTATSTQIDSIGIDLIEGIKEERTLILIRSLKLREEKSLFSADEIFSQIDSADKEGNVFMQDENDVLNLLVEKGKIRNWRNLEYLSAEKQSENFKIKFTLHPEFGFLFLVEGEKNHHFIWELRNSNATYLWSVEKDENDVRQHFKRIEKTIHTVAILKREQYKRDYKSGLIDSDLKFYSIDHEKISSDEEGGFKKWKERLEGLLK